MSDIPMALTIAGSETTGGAGMQADLKTFEEYGVHGMVVLTSIVTMLPDKGWEHEVFPVGLDIIEKQLTTVLAGRPVAAMKTGMLPGAEVIELVRRAIEAQHFAHVVIDPVMVCKADVGELNVESADALRERLVPLATVATPNLFEAGVLSGLGTLQSVEDMKKAAKRIHGDGAQNVVVKGGSMLAGSEAVDVLYDGRDYEVLSAPKVAGSFNQGAGCTFSAAVTAGLANGLPVREAVVKAKGFVRAAIAHGFAFNQFVGPVCHAASRVFAGA